VPHYSGQQQHPPPHTTTAGGSGLYINPRYNNSSKTDIGTRLHVGHRHIVGGTAPVAEPQEMIVIDYADGADAARLHHHPHHHHRHNHERLGSGSSAIRDPIQVRVITQ
jgi:hypothetical protein